MGTYAKTLFVGLLACPVLGHAGDPGDDTPPSPDRVRTWIQELASEDEAIVLDRANKLTEAYAIARPELMRVFPHGPVKVRTWVTRVLIDRRDDQNTKLLEKLAETDHAATVRILSIKGLQRLEDHDLVPVLTRCLGRESDEANRKTLLRMIAMRRDERAVEAILDLIERSFDEKLVRCAYSALRSISGLTLQDEIGTWRAWWDARSSSRD